MMLRKIFTPMRLEVGGLTAAGVGLWSWSGQGWLWVTLNLVFLLCCILPAMNCCVNLKHLFRMRFDPEYRRMDERLDMICASLAGMGDHVRQVYDAVVDGV